MLVIRLICISYIYIYIYIYIPGEIDEENY